MQTEPLWLVSLCWVICMDLPSALAALERTCTPYTLWRGPDPRGICGQRIDETLSLLCMGSYFSGRKKRETTIHDKISKLKGILIPREDANSFLVKRSEYHQQGIVCECCYHRCSIRELFGYCGDTAPNLFDLFKRSLPERLKQGRP